MADIISRALNGHLDSLVADSSALDTMNGDWADFVSGDLAGELAIVHHWGSYASYLGGEATGKLPAWMPSNWAAVVNDSAVNYAANATNRLVRVGDEVWSKVRSEVSQAVQAGTSMEGLKGQIETLTTFSEFRSDTIARTETMGAYNGGDRAGAVALGQYGPVEHSWLATSDRRTREDHAQADGQCVPFDQPFDVGGERLLYPHDPSGSAAQVVNCRCVAQDYYVGDTRPDGSVIEGDTIAADYSAAALDAIDALPAPATASARRIPEPGTGIGFSATELHGRVDISPTRLGDLKHDMAGMYNRALVGTDFRVDIHEMHQWRSESALSWSARIFDASGERVGFMERSLARTADGDWVVNHDLFQLRKGWQGQGIASRLQEGSLDYYRSIGVDAVTTHANIDVGGYTWGKTGFDFDFNWADADSFVRLQLDQMTRVVTNEVYASERALAKSQIVAMRLAVENGVLPTPYELGQVGWTKGAKAWVGKDSMLGSSWYGRLDLR